MLDLAAVDPLSEIQQPPGALRPATTRLPFPHLPSPEAVDFLQRHLAERWIVTPRVLERVVEFSDRLNAAAEQGQALLVVGVHRDNFPSLGYLVHGLRERGVRAFGTYVLHRMDETKPEPFEDIVSCRSSFGVLAEIIQRAPNVPVYLQAHAQRSFLSQLIHALRPELKIYQEIYDWMDSFVDPAHEAQFESEGVFSQVDIQVMRASERYVRTRTSGFIYKDGGEPMARLLGSATVPSLQMMPCPPRSFQLAPQNPPDGPLRLVHAGQLRSAGSSRAFSDIYTAPLYEDLLSQGLDVSIFPSATSPQSLEEMFGDYRRLAEREPRAHFMQHLPLRELIDALHGQYHYGMLLYHFDPDLIVGKAHLQGALASKMFVYWAAGLPALVSEELAYMATLVRETGAGLVVKRSDLPTLGARLQSLDYAELQRRVVAAQQKYHIEHFIPALCELLTRAD